VAASTNASFIVDLEELWEILDKDHIYSLVSEETSEEVTDLASDLTAEQLGRLYRFLNWGKDRICGGLRERYSIDNLAAVNATKELKALNAKYAEWGLERRRYRSAELCSNSLEELDAILENYAKAESLWGLSSTVERSHIPVGAFVDSKATQFDSPGHFVNIIPERETDDIWPDGANE